MSLVFRDPTGERLGVLNKIKEQKQLSTISQALDYSLYKTLKTLPIITTEINEILRKKQIEILNYKINYDAKILYTVSNMKRSFYKQASNQDIEIKDIIRNFKKTTNDLMILIDGEQKANVEDFRKKLTEENVKELRMYLIYLLEYGGLSIQRLNKMPLKILEDKILHQTLRVQEYEKTHGNEKQ